MISAAATALSDILSPPFRGVLIKSLALTIGLLVALWLAFEWLLTRWVATSWPWLNTAFDILGGIGLVVGLGFLAAPVAALFVGFFADDIAEGVEQAHYPTDMPGRPLPIGRYELRFAVGDHFRRRGIEAGDPPFLDIVPLRFSVAEPEGHYHVPLLCTPWSYSTYRGS